MCMDIYIYIRMPEYRYGEQRQAVVERERDKERGSKVAAQAWLPQVGAAVGVW